MYYEWRIYRTNVGARQAGQMVGKKHLFAASFGSYGLLKVALQ